MNKIIILSILLIPLEISYDEIILSCVYEDLLLIFILEAYAKLLRGYLHSNQEEFYTPSSYWFLRHASPITRNKNMHHVDDVTNIRTKYGNYNKR